MGMFLKNSVLEDIFRRYFDDTGSDGIGIENLI